MYQFFQCFPVIYHIALVILFSSTLSTNFTSSTSVLLCYFCHTCAVSTLLYNFPLLQVRHFPNDEFIIGPSVSFVSNCGIGFITYTCAYRLLSFYSAPVHSRDIELDYIEDTCVSWQKKEIATNLKNVRHCIELESKSLSVSFRVLFSTELCMCEDVLRILRMNGVCI